MWAHDLLSRVHVHAHFALDPSACTHNYSLGAKARVPHGRRIKVDKPKIGKSKSRAHPDPDDELTPLLETAFQRGDPLLCLLFPLPCNRGTSMQIMNHVIEERNKFQMKPRNRKTQIIDRVISGHAGFHAC